MRNDRYIFREKGSSPPLAPSTPLSLIFNSIRHHKRMPD